MYYSLNKKLAKLPNNTHVFPGHNYHQLKYSTIAQEKKSNPYFQIDNVSDFITRKAWGDNNQRFIIKTFTEKPIKPKRTVMNINP